MVSIDFSNPVLVYSQTDVLTEKQRDFFEKVANHDGHGVKKCLKQDKSLIHLFGSVKVHQMTENGEKELTLSVNPIILATIFLFKEKVVDHETDKKKMLKANSQKGYRKVMRNLIWKGGILNEVEKITGNTALHILVMHYIKYPGLDMVNLDKALFLLYNSSIDHTIENNDGNTALDLVEAVELTVNIREMLGQEICLKKVRSDNKLMNLLERKRSVDQFIPVVDEDSDDDTGLKVIDSHDKLSPRLTPF